MLIALGVTITLMFFRKVSYDGQTYADDTVESQVSIHKKELAAEVSRMLFED